MNSAYLELRYIPGVSNTCVTLIAVPRNYDPALHPFEVPREYVRALNATKLERVFAKPFLNSLDGHRDGINCMAKHPKSLSTVLSGACDGEVSCSYTNKQGTFLPSFLFLSLLYVFFLMAAAYLSFVSLFSLIPYLLSEGATYPLRGSVSRTAGCNLQAAAFSCEQSV